MLEKLPAKALLKAIVAERRMIEDDVANMRLAPSHDTTSILAVCHFLETVADGKMVSSPEMMVDDWTICGKVLHKLVAAGEVPKSVETQFDTTFFKVMEHALV